MAQRTCIVCGEEWEWINDRPDRRGRPPLTCGPACKEERLRELWRRSYPKQLERQRRRRSRGSAYMPMVCSHPDGCDRAAYSNGLCTLHYARLNRIGTLGPVGTMRKHGYEYTDKKNGYVYMNHPTRPGRIAKHRWVMEQVIGRPLLPNESPHHINGDRSDNRPENLELWSKAQPAGQRVEDKVAYALEILALYRPEALS